MTATGLHVRHPASLEEALALAQMPGARFVAGGTALQLEWTKGVAQPPLLVDLGRIGGLSGIDISARTVRIGALATLSAVGSSAGIAQALPMLAAAVRTVAGPAVRNLGTIGGNVAGRTGCLLPVLLALDARLEMTTDRGRISVSIAQWLPLALAHPPVVGAIVIPRPVPATCWTQRKIGLRTAFTPSMIGVAGMIDREGETIADARLSVGGGVVRPKRLPGVEALLRGKSVTSLDWTLIRAALRDEIDAPDDDFRSGRYRNLAAANALVHGLAGVLPGDLDRKKRRVDLPPAETSARTLLDRTTSAHRWHVRPDAAAKVDGRLPYLTDRREPAMLVGRILRAGVPHARILSIDTAAARALPGVAAVVTHRDIAGENGFGIILPDQPAFCFDTVRYAGDAVAAVAAVDAKTAAEALSLIRVEYAPLPVVGDPARALLPGAPLVHASGNLMSRFERTEGDVDAVFAEAPHVLEAVYSTARQMHGFMETEGGYAFVEKSGADDAVLLTVCAGGQHGGRDRFQLSRILGLPEAQIRVVTSPTGGAFGGKDELTVQPALALLALKTGRSVRLQLDRAESVQAGTKRHPMTIRMRTACDADGHLLAQSVDVLADGGAYASLGPAVVETALEHACGPYVVPNSRAVGRIAYTNNGVCGAFRGFGANQMAFAIECQMDRMAALCGLDPFDIRCRNLRKPGTPGALGQTVAPSERLFDMLAAASADPLWARPAGLSADGSEWIGIGMAMNYQGNGLGTLPPDPAGGGLRLAADGAIEAVYGLDELGQGLLTAARAAVAQALGCARDDVRAVTGDTALATESGSTTASRGTYVVWKAASLAAPGFAEKILTRAAGVLGRDAFGLFIAPGGIAERGSNSGVLLLTFAELARALPPQDRPLLSVQFDFPKTGYDKGNARFIFAYGATLARVAVSRVTGTVRVLDLVQHTAAGPVLDAAAYLGQIEGGGLQGLGFTLTEDAGMRDGRFVTDNLDTYMIPGIADVPPSMVVHAQEDLDPGDPFGPRGVGELGIGAVTPAIANALADALGRWPEAIPVSPESLLDVMQGLGVMEGWT